jgi:hypothetical protein
VAHLSSVWNTRHWLHRSELCWRMHVLLGSALGVQQSHIPYRQRIRTIAAQAFSNVTNGRMQTAIGWLLLMFAYMSVSMNADVSTYQRPSSLFLSLSLFLFLLNSPSPFLSTVDSTEINYHPPPPPRPPTRQLDPLPGPSHPLTFSPLNNPFPFTLTFALTSPPHPPASASY